MTPIRQLSSYQFRVSKPAVRLSPGRCVALSDRSLANGAGAQSSWWQGTEPPIPVPVPVPDLPGIGDGGPAPDLPGIGSPSSPPRPSDPRFAGDRG